MDYEIAKIVLLPTLEKKLKKIKDKHQIKRVYSFYQKIKRSGLKQAKPLFSMPPYHLFEFKSMRPPYRLYIIYDADSKTAYMYDWVHKEQQEKAINELKESIKRGLMNVF